MNVDTRMDIGIEEKNRREVVAILNRLLADEYVLYTKTRNFHWNVTGPNFHDLHLFFQNQYDALDEIVDDVAERARSLGGTSLGSMREFVEHARLQEVPGGLRPSREMVAELARDHESVIRQLRGDLEACDEKYGDVGTNDFLTGLMEKHEKMAWMLRATCEER